MGSFVKCKFSVDPDWVPIPVRQRGSHGVPLRRLEGVSEQRPLGQTQ